MVKWVVMNGGMKHGDHFPLNEMQFLRSSTDSSPFHLLSTSGLLLIRSSSLLVQATVLSPPMRRWRAERSPETRSSLLMRAETVQLYSSASTLTRVAISSLLSLSIQNNIAGNPIQMHIQARTHQRHTSSAVSSPLHFKMKGCLSNLQALGRYQSLFRRQCDKKLPPSTHPPCILKSHVTARLNQRW